jgi:HlyD family secretion protein
MMPRKLGKRAISLATGAILVGALAGVFIYWNTGESPALSVHAQTNAPPPDMNVAALGRIEPQSEIINIGSGIADRLESLLVHRGDLVAKGQILGYLQTYAQEVAQRNQIAAQLKDAKEKLATTISLDRVRIANAKNKLKTINDVSPLKVEYQEATIKGLDAALKNDRATMEAYSKLLSVSASSQRKYDDQETLVRRDQAALRAAKARLAEIKQQFDADRADAELQIQLQLATMKRDEADFAIGPLTKQLALQDVRVRRATIYAPIAGRILNIFARPGELVGSAPLLAMGDTTKMRVVAEVYETDIGRVKIGQVARITSPTLKTPIMGRVVEIGWMIYKNDVLNVDPAARADARVVQVRIELDDAKRTQRLTNHTVDVLIYTDFANAKVSRATTNQ